MITSSEVRNRPYGEFSITNTGIQIKEKALYMMCLSPMAMLDEYGENCGIDLELLAQKLGVLEVKLSTCATDIVKKTGINRVWGCRTPEYRMYASGSVFKIECSQVPEVKNLKEIEDNGVGVCKNEGCGRVVFLKDFDKINQKELFSLSGREFRKLDFQVKEEDIEKLTMLSAKGMLNADLKHSKETYLSQIKNDSNTPRSQSGILASMCKSMRYEENESTVKKKFSAYLKHVNEKLANQKVHFPQESQKDRKEITFEILNTPLEALFPDIKEIYCGLKLKELLSESEEIKIRLDLIRAKISAENRIGQGGI